MPNNYTLPSHLRLCSLFVATYDSQGLRWKYSNLPPHGALTQVGVGVRVLLAADSQSTSKSGYWASLWDPSPDFSLLFFLFDNYVILLSMRPL
jgi:hypothetical protein